MAIDYAALKTELTTNPTGLTVVGGATLQAAYAAGRDADCAIALNVVRAAITVNRPDISALEVLEAIDTRDFVASPTALQSAWFESITQFPRVRFKNDQGVNTRVRGNLNRLVNDTNGSQTRLDALGVRTGSRGEAMFGGGTEIDDGDIALARQA